MFMLALSAVSGFAQENNNRDSTGEIVMTKAQLQSFIRKIATLKKQHMEMHRQEMKLAQLEKEVALKNRMRRHTYDMERGYQEMAPKVRQPFITDEERLYRALERMNARIDALAQNLYALQSSMRSSAPSATAPMAGEEFQSAPPQNKIIPNAAPLSQTKIREIIRQELQNMRKPAPQQQNRQVPQDERNGETQQLSIEEVQEMIREEVQETRNNNSQRPVVIREKAPERIYVKTDRGQEPVVIVKVPGNGATPRVQLSDSLLLARQYEQGILKSRINNMEGQIQLLLQLREGSGEKDKNEYKEDIAILSAQIAALKNELEQKSQTTPADSVQYSNNQPLTEQIIEDSFTVYFANNSIQIPAASYQELQHVVSIMKNHPGATVVLRGYASPSGNPRYNDKISFQRATSVKNWLLDHGLRLADIITMHHGVDRSVDASRARRVEITFLVQ